MFGDYLGLAIRIQTLGDWSSLANRAKVRAMPKRRRCLAECVSRYAETNAAEMA